jgi:hypothetical protein
MLPTRFFTSLLGQGNALMPKSSENSDTRRARDAREEERMASLPATYVDGFTISWWSRGLRISFCEYVHEERYYRAAVSMQLDEAEDLGKVLLECVEKARAELRNGSAG